MGVLRPAARVLDAWGALIVGVAVVLGVIILLATPGPWREVVGAPPATAPAEEPRDVAVFVRGGPRGEDCTAAVWLHVEHAQPSLAAVVVPVQLEVAVPGAGYDRLCRVVRLFGPETATAALGRALGVAFAGSVSLSSEGLAAAVPTMFPAGHSSRERARRRAAVRAWEGRGPATAVFRRQVEQLAEALPAVPLESLSVVAVANYALGSELAESDLDLRQATTLAESARDVRSRDVAVRALPVVREVRGTGVFWRPRQGEARRLALSLGLGLRPAPTTARVVTVPRPGGVLVALPEALEAGDAAAFTAGLSAAIAASAGPGVAVDVERYEGGDLTPAVSAAVATIRPLAVVVVAPEGAPDGEAPDDQEGATPAAERWTARREAAACAAHLVRLYQPAVLVAPVAVAEAGGEVEAADDLVATGLPVLPVAVPSGAHGAGSTPAPSTGGTPSPSSAAAATFAEAGRRAAWTRAGRLAAATVVRACWPAVLAPELAGTARGVTFAERRTVELAVLGGEEAGETLVWLRACGYVPETNDGDWTAEAGVVRVAYHPGLRRLAFAVAGDLGALATLVAEDAGAPAPVTVVP